MNKISVYASEWGNNKKIIEYNNIRLELELEEIVELTKLITNDLFDHIFYDDEILYKHLNKIKHIKDKCEWIEKELLDRKIEDERFNAIYGK